MNVESIFVRIINTHDDAMTQDLDGEVQRVLRGIADRLDSGGGVISCLDCLVLRDSNGNTVGSVKVDWDDSSCGDEDEYEDENFYTYYT